ncbi:MAG: UDP-glucose 4-epimerase GalE [Lysobacteraceae bacterium]
MPPDPILVTGGAGYIGSHVVVQLLERGERVVVLDNLRTGVREAVQGCELVVGDVGDAALLDRLMAEHRFGTVMHFAARTIVPESVADPLAYYQANSVNAATLLSACRRNGIGRFVFSSTAAVYGLPPSGCAGEDDPLQPINPYGSSKLVTEWMLRDLAASAPDFGYIALRYFNVAGCDTRGRVGQNTPRATLLVKVAVEVACGLRSHLEVFGTDYPTHDGTGVRDYIHVEDLARAHLDALDHLRGGGRSQVLNCGYGHGYSVREVIAAVERATGEPLPVRFSPRRAGDPPTLVADSSRIHDAIGWRPRLDDIDVIVRTSLAWERRRQLAHAG